MAKVKLPNVNLNFLGSKHDTNGNKVIMLEFTNSKTRAFSIQIGGGTLSETRRILAWRKMSTQKELNSLNGSELKTISKEVYNYVSKYGSENQKKLIYKS